jgi:hypothetical protein
MLFIIKNIESNLYFSESKGDYVPKEMATKYTSFEAAKEQLLMPNEAIIKIDMEKT